MKKILLLLAVFLTSATLFSQTILTTWEFGPTAFSPVITFNDAPSVVEVISHVRVTNAGSSNLKVNVVREVIFQVENTMHTFCWGGACFGPDTDTSLTQMTLAPGEFTDEFSGHLAPNGTMGISVVKYTFYDIDNPTNRSEVLVNYNTVFSLSCESGDSVSMNTRMLSGVATEPLDGMIKVHNHTPAPLNLIAFKQPVNLIEGSENEFAFGGVTYPFGTDTSGLVTVLPSTIDESFMMSYNAMDYDGISQIVYVFLDPTNQGNFALQFIQYDATPSGISDEILANTTFAPAYPNPAQNYVSFDYDIPAEVNRAEILITNLLGGIVYESTLQGLNGTQKVDVSSLTGGIYFATLKLDNQVATSQKILVQ